MSDRTQPVAARVTAAAPLTHQPPQRLPPAAAWRARTVDGIIRQGLLTVRRESSDTRAAEALGAIFFSLGRRPRLPECQRQTLRDLAAGLRACLDPGAEASHWRQVTALIDDLLETSRRL
ncbi:hypothetical protein [Caenispirillum salinarum]|uniref:hypothetical protein n=1 Tax=Caenispirillum salinarum TaxID=859058 RepID=UPI00384E1A14